MNAAMDTPVRLRPYCLDDGRDLVEAVRESVSELQPWMPWCHSGYSITEARSWLAEQVAAFTSGTAYEFVIQASDGRYLGGCGLNQIDRVNRRANLGYWVRTSATRAGIATAAVEALRDWAFQNTDLIRLEIVVAVGNEASHRVAEKAGAIREGILYRRLLIRDLAHDSTMFSLTRPIRAAPAAGAS
jgi:ribosomal-protein-serine acetyltransferase